MRSPVLLGALVVLLALTARADAGKKKVDWSAYIEDRPSRIDTSPRDTSATRTKPRTAKAKAKKAVKAKKAKKAKRGKAKLKAKSRAKAKKRRR